MPFAAKTEPGEDENQASQTLAADKPSVKTAAPPAEETKVVAPAAAGAEPVHSEKGVGPEVKQAGIAPTTAASAAVPMAASSPVAPAESLSAPIATAAKAGRSGAPLVVAIVALLGVAGGALALTRRRARRQGLIHILETAAIGPKRALLVARVNGRTMVLGASEAGIALLASLDGTIEPPVAAVMGNLPAVRDQSHEPAPAPVDTVTDEPEGEMGVLSRLFRRRPKDSSAQDTAAFRELLEESYEDQELRDKLAQGLSGKVS
jgi:flagellar biogenesis protein FliO